MCFAAAIPIALAVSAAATAAGAAVAAKGQLEAGKAAQGQAEYSAKVDEHNATVASMEGQAKADAIGAEYDRTAASQRAAAAASGRNPDAGSPSLVIAETDKNRYLDTVTTLWNAQTSSDAYTHEAAGQRLAGANAKTASKYAAAGTFLTGLGQAASGAASARSASLRIS